MFLVRTNVLLKAMQVTADLYQLNNYTTFLILCQKKLRKQTYVFFLIFACILFSFVSVTGRGRGGGGWEVLPYISYIGMCHKIKIKII